MRMRAPLLAAAGAVCVGLSFLLPVQSYTLDRSDGELLTHSNLADHVLDPDEEWGVQLHDTYFVVKEPHVLLGRLLAAAGVACIVFCIAPLRRFLWAPVLLWTGCLLIAWWRFFEESEFWMQVPARPPTGWERYATELGGAAQTERVRFAIERAPHAWVAVFFAVLLLLLACRYARRDHFEESDAD